MVGSTQIQPCPFLGGTYIMNSDRLGFPLPGQRGFADLCEWKSSCSMAQITTPGGAGCVTWEVERWQWVEQVFRQVAGSYGYRELRTPF